MFKVAQQRYRGKVGKSTASLKLSASNTIDHMLWNSENCRQLAVAELQRKQKQNSVRHVWNSQKTFHGCFSVFFFVLAFYFNRATVEIKRCFISVLFRSCFNCATSLTDAAAVAFQFWRSQRSVAGVWRSWDGVWRWSWRRLRRSERRLWTQPSSVPAATRVVPLQTVTRQRARNYSPKSVAKPVRQRRSVVSRTRAHYG